MNAKASTNRPAPRLWIAVPVLLVLAIYLWFISAGKWTSWPRTAIYDYYSKLASAFQQGHIYLEEKPSAELLALPDPYRIGARKDITYIWDASLYHGRYYLYWGPTPALMLLPLKLALPTLEIGDNVLVFGFVSGLYAVLCLLSLRLWYRFFSTLPTWTLMLGLLLVGLMPPLTWMLNRPEVYEAALASAQCFLLGSVYWLFTAFDSDDLPIWRLALASAFWGLAIGARTSEALPVLLLVVAAGLRISSGSARSKLPGHRRGAFAALLVPVTLCGLGLGWYNWARFGSIFEFGYRYQLTLLQMPKHYSDIFSAAYVVPNLFNYLLNPFTVSAGFPFIKPQYGRTDFGPNILFPRIYFSEAITGLIYTLPFLIMGLILLVPRFRHAAPSDAREAHEGFAGDSPGWLRLSLFGVLVLEMAALLTFFFATERYLVEFTPVLTLLSLLGFWQGYRLLANHSRLRAVFSGFTILLAASSIISTTLLAISSYQERFLTANPDLMSQINRFFGH